MAKAGDIVTFGPNGVSIDSAEWKSAPEILLDRIAAIRAIWCPTCDCKGPEKAWNTRALASLEGDAVERVARIIDPTAFAISPSVFGLDTEDEMERETVVGPARSIARGKARAILATGLVPDEAAIRADERPLGDVFNELVRRMNFGGMDPRTFTLGELERAIDGAEFPK